MADKPTKPTTEAPPTGTAPTKTPPAIWAAVAVLVGGFMNIAYAAGTGRTKVAVWLVTLAMIVLLCACIGRAIADRWDGVLIDSRKRISLSRLQMIAWTVLILSALITAISSNLANDPTTTAFVIKIHDELLAAMGIAATSLAATPALLTLKGPDPANGASRLATNDAPKDAGWLDMFRGDEASDQDLPDLSKIQQFLISLAMVGGYGMAIGYLLFGMSAGAHFGAFPPLDPKFIWLLGISHAGYLTYKAAPKPGNPPS